MTHDWQTVTVTTLVLLLPLSRVPLPPARVCNSRSLPIPLPQATWLILLGKSRPATPHWNGQPTTDIQHVHLWRWYHPLWQKQASQKHTLHPGQIDQVSLSPAQQSFRRRLAPSGMTLTTSLTSMDRPWILSTMNDVFPPKRPMSQESSSGNAGTLSYP